MIPDRLRVLVIEDSPGDAALVRMALRDAVGPAFDLDFAHDLPEAVARLAKGNIDVVLTDLNLPSSTGLDTVKAVLPRARGIPIVVLTGSYADTHLGQAAVRLGVQDYLDKQKLDAGVLSRLLVFAVERKGIERQQEEFLQNVNHELRSPLTVAAGFLHCLRDGAFGDLDKEQAAALAIVMRNVESMTRLVEDIAELTRAGAGKLAVRPRRTDLDSLLVDTAEEFRIAAKEKGVAMAATSRKNLGSVLADPQRCRQMLFNLIANAIKFTPRGGRISLTAAASAEEPGFLRVCVSDSGPGVPPEARERIFERLYQERGSTKGHRGLGLGLFICGELARGQGGRIWMEEVPGGGSRFCFTLPAFSFAAALSPLLRAPHGPPGLSLLGFRVLPGARRLQRSVAAEFLEEARDALKTNAGPYALLLPPWEPEGTDAPLYLALRADAPAAAAAARRLAQVLGALPRTRETGIQFASTVTAVSAAGGTPAELELAIEGIVAPNAGLTGRP